MESGPLTSVFRMSRIMILAQLPPFYIKLIMEAGPMTSEIKPFFGPVTNEISGPLCSEMSGPVTSVIDSK